MIDRTPYTTGAREALKLAKAEAQRLGHSDITPEHYLLGLIRKGDGMAIQTFMNLNIDPDKVKLALEQMVGKGNKTPIGLFSDSPDAQRVLDTAKHIGIELKHKWVGTEHLLLAILKEENTLASRCLRQFGLDYEKARNEIMEIIGLSSQGKPRTDAWPSEAPGILKPVSQEVKSLLSTADAIAQEMDHMAIWPEHLLLAMLMNKQGAACNYLSRFGIHYETAKRELAVRMTGEYPESKPQS